MTAANAPLAAQTGTHTSSAAHGHRRYTPVHDLLDCHRRQASADEWRQQAWRSSEIHALRQAAACLRVSGPTQLVSHAPARCRLLPTDLVGGWPFFPSH